ncbi:MAG: MinD/ParA family protein [Nitrospinaceae bacterium]|jgi:flagellar biosynthesis protein FlhG|nr:MinD/ParA family protein [Nitrospina sp.]MBT5867882.1 MinD/ParA family protein [Nitrospinaceae bacterium]MBT6346560.1 MinD/ParA family protein [Nitrospina sp.]
MFQDNQASTLKRMAYGKMSESNLRVLAVSSGKGGVGKTNFVANLAYALSKRGKKVLVVDADLGLNNIDILLGLTPQKHIGHVLAGECSIEDIILRGPADIHVLPAGDGLQELTQLQSEKKMLLMDELDRVSHGYDFLIFDTGAGISTNVTYFCSAAHETLLIATTEPTSLTDVYALIKTLHNKHAQKNFRMIINSVSSEREAQGVYRNLTAVTDRFLAGVSIEYLGYILQDPNVPKAVRQQKAFLELYPFSKFSVCINDLAEKISKEKPSSLSCEGAQPYFWRSAFPVQ